MKGTLIPKIRSEISEKHARNLRCSNEIDGGMMGGMFCVLPETVIQIVRIKIEIDEMAFAFDLVIEIKDLWSLALKLIFNRLDV